MSVAGEYFRSWTALWLVRFAMWANSGNVNRDNQTTHVLLVISQWRGNCRSWFWCWSLSALHALACCSCCKCFLIQGCTQLPTGSRLVHKHTAHSAVSADRGQITFSPKMNSIRVCLEAYRDHLSNQVSVHLFGPLLVHTWVQLLHSHLHRQTAPHGGNTLKLDSTALSKAGVKVLWVWQHYWKDPYR